MLKVGGFTPLSTTDWPGQLAAVVFVQGCPWRCHYCHNAELQTREGGLPGGWLQVLGTLARRQGLLDGVVFSGGEPTLDPDLPDAIQTVRGMGFKVGLHTAGVYPERLASVLPFVDWIGFDVKTDFARYEDVTAIPRSGVPAWRSLQGVLEAVKQQGLALEVRTTWHPQLHNDDSMVDLARTLVHLGISEWVLQPFQDAHVQTARHDELRETWSAPSSALLQRLRDTGVALAVR
ncbi:MAG TPA: anaerobic ribonucleoside-triphosphate reductase activating protein [Aquabacterium sp.]|uniref:anaerobic ribonucleoside-triphosphate reductase activating protein n=1 Tax=Aquabacterium sp. TaxID=1872578 RepID=UPI002E322C2F|nr:anaerobic ribonucleoside-triphosphate reductase activating protein [Aquabacterium sp.]HEX5357599.1 anaerobic ribonucleoside-triphosphate reductase activating protein [Aquabacterium sp.]